jgi:F-type H+-transporting ATPase subunit epsilon
MADSVAFELVSPERLLISEAVDMVVVPGTDGNFGVLPRHAPMISTLRPGVMDIYKGGQITQRIFVAGGFAEVTPDRCTVLADVAIPVAELDPDKAEQALKDAREDLADAKTDVDKKAAEKSVAVAQAMIEAARR